MWVEIVSGLLAEYRSDPCGMKIGRIGCLMNGLSRFGMSPSGRAGVSTLPQPPQPNPFAEFVDHDLPARPSIKRKQDDKPDDDSDD